MWFVGWVEMDLWAPPGEQVGMRKHDHVWGAVKGRQYTELAIVLATDGYMTVFLKARLFRKY